MKNRWNFDIAPESELELRAYSSRLIGEDPALVLHGGGNTSLKTNVRDVFDQDMPAIFVKASGFDLATMWTEGFTGLDLEKLKLLANLTILSDPDMVREVRRAQLDPSQANASIEAIVHAIIPFRFVDHSHADAILTISNAATGSDVWKQIYGERVAVLPYVKPGFDLARQLKNFGDGGGFNAIDGLVLEHHGLFTFADSARQSYDQHIKLVHEAEQWLIQQFGVLQPAEPLNRNFVAMAKLRHAVGRLAGTPVLSRPSCSVSPSIVEKFVAYAAHGTVTPEHVIHNKPFPAHVPSDFESGLARFTESYQAYFARANNPKLERLSLNPHWAVFDDGDIRSFGPNLKRADVSSDVARTTAKALLYALEAGGWQGLAEEELRELEYWDLEQAKLTRLPKAPELTGKIAIVTGAAAGIGRAIARTLHARGAVVVGFDINPDVTQRLALPGLQGKVVDATDDSAVRSAVDQVVHDYGGLDILVSNAGVFTAGATVEALDDETWRQSMTVNLDAHMRLVRAAIPVLRHGFDPSILFMASRNVSAPGAGAAAYSVAKAGLTQLMRVLALELASDGITVNALHPDAVFDTELWTMEALQRSAGRYGLTVEEYKTRNLLKSEVTSQDVANAALVLINGTLRRTTGAQIPVDGGNDRVI